MDCTNFDLSQDLDGLRTGAANGEHAGDVDESTKRLADEKARHLDEIAQLKEQLESTRSAKQKAIEEAETLRQDAESVARNVEESQKVIQRLESDRVEVSRC